MPKNDDGEDNPHIHLLMDWRADRKHFAGWAKRIESIWGNGAFHLERIKDPTAAGAYMAKAAGYMTKAAGDDDQGEVRGNRYAISSAAPCAVLGDFISKRNGDYGTFDSRDLRPYTA